MKSFFGVAVLVPLYVGRVSFAVAVSLGRVAEGGDEKSGVSQSSHLEVARRLLREERFKINREDGDANEWRVVRSRDELRDDLDNPEAQVDEYGLHDLQFGREMYEMRLDQGSNVHAGSSISLQLCKLQLHLKLIHASTRMIPAKNTKQF